MQLCFSQSIAKGPWPSLCFWSTSPGPCLIHPPALPQSLFRLLLPPAKISACPLGVLSYEAGLPSPKQRLWPQRQAPALARDQEPERASHSLCSRAQMSLLPARDSAGHPLRGRSQEGQVLSPGHRLLHSPGSPGWLTAQVLYRGVIPRNFPGQCPQPESTQPNPLLEQTSSCPAQKLSKLKR